MDLFFEYKYMISLILRKKSNERICSLLFFKFIIRKLRFFLKSSSINNESETDTQTDTNQQAIAIKTTLDENLTNLRSALSESTDLKIHSIRFGQKNEFSGAVVFIDGLTDSLIMTNAILSPLKNWTNNLKILPETDIIDILEQEVLCASDTTVVHSIPELAIGCLSGDTILIVDGYTSGLILSSKGWEKRSISEPQSETVVRGPREGFTENLQTNTSLIRRKIRNGQLHVEQMVVGRKTQTNICLMYLNGVANPKIVNTVKERIDKLDVESILETGYIEEYIDDAPYSPFATIGYTEKPDVAAAGILEGRIVILVDGTPFVLTAPMLFVESFQTAEDYYSRSLYSSLIRIMRYIAFIITIFGPAIYIALNSFHLELIPTTLLFTIAKAREGTPFPVFIEALIMIFAFEILREAGVRLPQPVGQAISIVGALIMGDAAINAGVVGAPMVITIAFTAVAGFLVPKQNESVSILRVVMMIPASIIGLYGVGIGALGILIHLASLESFGVPYFDCFDRPVDMQDTIIRVPLWMKTKRPRHLAKGDTTRGIFFIPPIRPHANNDNEGEP